MPDSFRELKVWNKAIELTERIYTLTGSFPRSETYGLSSQMQRASVSIASNVAEGSARGSKRDFRAFVRVAKGSTCELQTQLVIARRLGYGGLPQIELCESLAVEIGRMLAGLSNYLTTEIRASRNEHTGRRESISPRT